MIHETTWHPSADRRTHFVWSTSSGGVEIFHGDSAPYLIEWEALQDVYQYAKKLASQNDGIVIAGTCQDSPTKGSVGEWISQSELNVQNATRLTPRHLSFIGPILARMRLVSRHPDDRMILWKIDA